MAKGKKTGGRDFRPGQSGNPRGPERLPEDIKQLRAFNKLENERALTKYWLMRRDEFIEESKKTDLPVNEVYVIALINKGVTLGDPNRFNCVLDRLIGKVTTQVEVSTGGGDIKMLMEMPQADRDALIEKHEKRRKGLT